MLFNSYEFILFFLPVTLAGFFLVSRYLGREGAILWLVAASLFYYGWWNPVYLVLIVLSMVFNFAIGRAIGGMRDGTGQDGARKALFVGGIAANLGLLGYYKYANFFVDNLGQLTGQGWSLETIILPLAISFFTFQQIAYLVDAWQGAAREYNFSHYALFVTFFPQLIAGPIVHHSEMMPQFAQDQVLRPQFRNFAIGMTIFAIGLFKKAVLADSVAAYATPVFEAANNGVVLTALEAWGGALAYTMQLYFDFSGYSDMAIGAARMFGIRLPLNFFSPYKATSIVEFWRRWHMTLSRFLRDYLYFPLGGNRKGNARRYFNLATTMVLGGLWHGAGWTFVAWGALHGIYLIINHAWHWVRRVLGLDRYLDGVVWRAIAWALTFLAVVVGWVFFRAESFDAAISMLAAMIGANGIALPNAIAVRLPGGVMELLGDIGIGTYLGGGKVFVLTYLWVAALLVVALVVPNTAQIMHAYRPTVNRFPSEEAYCIQPLRRWMAGIRWRPTSAWAITMAVVAGLGFLALTSISEFLYFQF
jgi:D-alanyl-lipoteichoic acid acyltransferase DltB (MBOAT superfamily)